MKINSTKLTNFFKKATLNGIIPTCTLKLDKDVLSVKVRDTTNAAAVMSTLKGLKTEETLIMPLKNTKMFLDILRLFNGDIELRVSGNILSIFDKNRQVDIVLAAEDFITNNLPKDVVLQYEKSVVIPSDIFKNSLKNLNILKSKSIELMFKDSTLTLSTGDKGFDTIKESLPVVYPECNAKFGSLLQDVINVVDEKIELSVKTNYPITLKESTTDLEVTYIIAPIVEQEE